MLRINTLEADESSTLKIVKSSRSSQFQKYHEKWKIFKDKIYIVDIQYAATNYVI